MTKSTNPRGMQLLSEEQREIFDLIDQLRAEGLQHHLGLPQLIVCGDQSSGKSSVLEAISGVKFPVKDNLCTRFATELILRQSPEEVLSVSIHPAAEHSASEKARLQSFRPSSTALEDFATIIASATGHMGIEEQGFSKNILRVEVSGPEQPHLTLVDLPGLYHAAEGAQDVKGAQLVEDLVLTYMRNRRSIILLVISAKNDIALQKASKLAREIDPSGTRTMGIITKPDKLDEASEMEQSFISLALNEKIVLDLGWHVLRNRAFGEENFSRDERNVKEEAFFRRGAWTRLLKSCCGIDSLIPRLCRTLTDLIRLELPRVMAEAQDLLYHASSALQKLGAARQTISEQRLYLLTCSERFKVLTSQATGGSYDDPFFGDPLEDEGYARRLRAVVQARLQDFSIALRDHGEKKQILEDHEKLKDANVQIHRADFIKEVQLRMQRSRGRELTGLYNPLIIGELFYIQAQPWENLVKRYTDTLLDDVSKVVMAIASTISDAASLDGIFKHILGPALEEQESSLRRKIAELLRPQQSGHPITYHPSLADSFVKIRAQNAMNGIESRLRATFNKHYFEDPDALNFSLNHLKAASEQNGRHDMEIMACSEAVDCMLAYYEIARDKFVDDFSNLAIEHCLLKPLITMFSSSSIAGMNDQLIQDIAAEDESTQSERARLEAKTVSLKKSLFKMNGITRYQFNVYHRGDDANTIASDGDSKASFDSEHGSSSPTFAQGEAANRYESIPERRSNGMWRSNDGLISPLPEDHLEEVVEVAYPVPVPALDPEDDETSFGLSKRHTKKKRNRLTE